MRYNDPSHHATWKAGKGFPKIHDAIYQTLAKHLKAGTAGPVTPTRFCDLCCSIGLLGQRILEGAPGRYVVGVEGLAASVTAARGAGITYPILNQKITPATLPEFARWLQIHKVEVLVARRCLSELFAEDARWGPRFWSACVASGVRMAVIQGRAPCGNPTHPIPDVDKEIAVLGHGARVVEKVGQCAVLVPV